MLKYSITGRFSAFYKRFSSFLFKNEHQPITNTYLLTNDGNVLLTNDGNYIITN